MCRDGAIITQAPADPIRRIGGLLLSGSFNPLHIGSSRQSSWLIVLGLLTRPSSRPRATAACRTAQGSCSRWRDCRTADRVRAVCLQRRQAAIGQRFDPAADRAVPRQVRHRHQQRTDIRSEGAIVPQHDVRARLGTGRPLMLNIEKCAATHRASARRAGYGGASGRATILWRWDTSGSRRGNAAYPTMQLSLRCRRSSTERQVPHRPRLRRTCGYMLLGHRLRELIRSGLQWSNLGCTFILLEEQDFRNDVSSTAIRSQQTTTKAKL